MKKKKIIIIVASILLIVTVVTIVICNLAKPKQNIHLAKVDDWVYSKKGDKGLYIEYSTSSTGIDTNMGIQTIGLSTGGAKDIGNFRQNIKSNYFPIVTDITYEGIFYDYNFNTGRNTEPNGLFYPSYSYALSKDPISGEKEYYMTVGLNSNIKQSDFKRKKLNLVIMLDISGSMASSMNEYYYDNRASRGGKTKMYAAEEAINCLIDKLNDDDRFGVVLFDDNAYLGKEMSLVRNTDLSAIKEHILNIQEQGGTNFSAGYKKSTDLFNKLLKVDSNEYENRIIVITDAMPNLGEVSEDGLYNQVKENSNIGINTTFIGVGVDFNTELIEAIGKVRGSNYYSVHNTEEFNTRMGEQFEYMVTPLVYDLKLDFNSTDFKIEQIYGSDAVNKDTGNIMNINTLFPSASNSEGEVKGGVVLLKLKPNQLEQNGDKIVKLHVSYKDRNGTTYSDEQDVNIKIDSEQEYYENTGIRKAIVLVRYVNAIKNWILYERTGDERFYITKDIGIQDCIYENVLGKNERSSVKLSVSKDYKEIFSKIKSYIQNENSEIKDSALEQEINILDKLINY